MEEAVAEKQGDAESRGSAESRPPNEIRHGILDGLLALHTRMSPDAQCPSGCYGASECARPVHLVRGRVTAHGKTSNFVAYALRLLQAPPLSLMSLGGVPVST